MERDDYSESKRQKKRRHHLRCLYPSQETLLRRRQHHTIYSPLNFSLRSVPHGFNPFTITLPHNGSSQLTHRKISGTTLVEGSNPGTFIWGGLKALFKLAIVAALRVFVPKSWPPLQIASLFWLFLHWLPRPLKTWGVTNMAAPVHYLSASAIGMRVAELIMKWSNPDLARTIRFWQHLLPIYLGYMKTKWLLRNKSMQERDESWAKTHEWGGQKVHNLVLDLSGFYVKSAQILATKADFVPEAWTKHLSSHLDNTPPRPFSEVEYSIRQELLRSPQGPSFTKDKNALVPLGVVFSHVEKIPIAAASIAQVHAGFLKDGTRIVIKVQHLRMETMMGSDLRNLAWVARFLKNQLPVDLEPIVKEIQSTIPLEFDFEREAWFMETIKRNLEKQNFRDIVCPIPYLNLCTKRLIVMQIPLPSMCFSLELETLLVVLLMFSLSGWISTQIIVARPIICFGWNFQLLPPLVAPVRTEDDQQRLNKIFVQIQNSEVQPGLMALF